MEKELHETQPASPPVATPDPVPSFPTKMHPLPSYKSKRLLLLIACLLALITTVYSFQYFAEQNKQKQEITIAPSPSKQAPTLSQVEDWKTYTNEKYNFSFKHPSHWKLESENKSIAPNTSATMLKSDDFILSDSKAPCCVVEGAKNGMVLTIYTEKNLDFSSYEKYKDFAENKATDRFFYNKVSTTNVSGLPATLKTEGEPYAGTQSEVYFFKEGNIYKMVFQSSKNQDTLFSQILSSFKFTQNIITRDKVEGLVRKKIDEEGLVKNYRVLIDGEDNFGWHVSVFDATKPNNEGLVGWYSVNRSTGEVKFLAP